MVQHQYAIGDSFVEARQRSCIKAELMAVLIGKVLRCCAVSGACKVLKDPPS